MFNDKERHKINTAHRLNPKIGDYWNEMFCPVLVVIGLKSDKVLICKSTKDCAENTWTWDLSKLEWLTKEQFSSKLTYGSKKMKDICFCDVVPEAHKWAREAAIKEMF
jgi:hypothetical protein